MRILALIFRAVFFLVLGGVVNFLLLREGLLVYGYLHLQQEVGRVRALVQNAPEYARLCKKTFVGDEQSYALAGIQLRFTDTRKYIVEVVCTDHARDPLSLRTGSLPPLVTHAAGSPGLYFGVGQPANTMVEIELWGRTSRITVRDAKITNLRTNYPVAQCTNWGYRCCDPITQVPDGFPTSTEVNDCRGSCYSVCKDRPVLLSFRSEPAFSIGSRVVRIKGTQASVTFTYVATQPGQKIDHVVMEYGDGGRDELANESGAVTHTYVCTRGGVCTYVARVTAYDKDGLSSPDLRTSIITVEVER